MIEELVVKAIQRAFDRAEKDNLSLPEARDLVLDEVSEEFDYEDSYNIE